jgi:hypothetical protein
MKKLLALSSALIISTSAFAWEKDNDPKFINPNFDKKFSTLPKHGELTTNKLPWASSFWPHVYSGIAFRWNDYYQGNPTFAEMHVNVGEIDKEIEEIGKEIYKSNISSYRIQQLVDKKLSLLEEKKRINGRKALHYKKYFFDMKRIESKADALRLTQDQIAKLSPAEKYDLYKGNYSLKLTNEVLNFTSPFDAYWEGICNGWASAAIEFEEPQPITVTNKDGIRISFGSSDLKALLSYYHSKITANKIASRTLRTGRVGQRCKTAFPKEAWFIKNGKEYYKSISRGKVVINPVPEECVDTNPGAFHIVMANMLGKMNTSFVAEVVRDKEVWNQPVNGYSSEVLEETTNIRRNATKGTRRQLKIKTIFEYANDGGRMFWPQNDPEEEFYAWWNPTNGTANYRKAEKTFEYYLDLDKRGNIIGGMWLTYERPDFIWVKRSKGFIGTSMWYGIVNYLDGLKNLVELR